jgi:hypothetical protein
MEHAVRHNGQFHKDPTTEGFGLSVSLEMLEVQGRRLEPPELEYCKVASPHEVEAGREAAATRVTVTNGSWNLRDLAFRYAHHAFPYQSPSRSL